MTKEVKFYEKMWFMWLMLFTVTPVGIFLMWKYDRYHKIVKIIISIFFGFTFLMFVIACFTDTEETQNAASNNAAVESKKPEPTKTPKPKPTVKNSFAATPSPSPAPLTKEEALEIDKTLYSAVLASEKIMNDLQNRMLSLTNSNGSEFDLYELAKKAKSDLNKIIVNPYYKTAEGAQEDYGYACDYYNTDCSIICDYYMKYLEKHNVKDLSKAKEYLTETLPKSVNNIAICRLKFLKETGFSEEEIQAIIKSTQ